MELTENCINFRSLQRDGVGKQAEVMGTSSYASGARMASNNQGENRLKGPEALEGWRKSRAVQPAHTLRRTNEVQSVLLGAWDQSVPQAHGCTSRLPAAHLSCARCGRKALQTDRHQQQLAYRL